MPLLETVCSWGGVPGVPIWDWEWHWEWEWGPYPKWPCIISPNPGWWCGGGGPMPAAAGKWVSMWSGRGESPVQLWLSMVCAR